MTEPKKEDVPQIVPPGTQLDTEPIGEVISEPSTEPPIETPPEDPRFEGKTMEDMVADFKNLEDHSSRLAQQLGDAKTELSVRDRMAQQQQPQQQPINPWQNNQPQAPPQEPDRDGEFLDSPTKVVNEMIQQRMGQFEQVMRQQAGINQATMAKQMAKSQNPQLFNGLDENALDQMMYGGVQGGQLNPEFLGNPEGWVMAAWQLRGKNSGFSMTSPPPRATSPTGTELPPQVKAPVSANPTPIAPAGWNEEGGLWDKMNISPEMRKEILEKQKGK